MLPTHIEEPIAMAEKEFVKTQLRLPEELQARLVASAKKTGRSMNSEIVERLEKSFLQEEVFGTTFGDDPEPDSPRALVARILMLQRLVGGLHKDLQKFDALTIFKATKGMTDINVSFGPKGRKRVKPASKS